MKNKTYIWSLVILSLFITSFVISTYAEVINVISGYNQVTNLGGENNVNTSGLVDNVKVSKTIEETNIENYFDITLKVESAEKVDEIIKNQDLAIVIVMDVSNTMIEGKVGNITRYEAAINAANSLIDDFALYSNGVDAVRQLGYVAFNTDSHNIFSLQDCKNATSANTLKNVMSTETSKIVNASGYKTSHSRFTNIEAGLKRAKDMLDVSNVKNKYIILLTDGFPTTYISSGYIGYDPYMSLKTKLPTSSSNGNFYNEIYKLPCKHGTDYSDRAAIKARELATTIKNSGINIFSVGTGLDVHKTISYYMGEDAKRVNNKGDQKFATVDTETTNFEIGSTIQDYKDWLKNSIGSSFYYDANNLDELKKAYALIFDKVKELSEEKAEVTWVAEDEMGSFGSVNNIEFVGLYDDGDVLHDSLNNKLDNQSDTASFANNKISWDLKNSEYTTKVVDNITYYTYEVKYRVRLENELSSFDKDGNYQTNGTTRLTYVTRVDGVISEDKYIDFPIPSVKGYLGSLEFTKKSSFDDTTLEGASFKLVHDENCECKSERKYPIINDFTSISNSNGLVLFDNIPSGHKYKLMEVSTLDDYILSSDVYDVVISFGKTSGGPTDYIFTNDIKKTSLKIKKKVNGNVVENKEFEFELEVYFKDKLLTGEYTYKLNNGNDKTINLSVDNIKLKNNDKIVIYDLPVGATYKIKEINDSGYNVEYQINSMDVKVGKLATCNSDNGCRLENKDNQVIFTNYAIFMLPATGSSATLIMVIIGTLLLVGPVIYISYLFYKDRLKC